jgi:F420-dependent oxidoreductase-like protein
MRLGLVIDYAGGFEETVERLSDYERAGLELVAVPEPYSFDSVSQLGYIAARTREMQLMSSILQIFTRTPALTAMTAAGLDYVSGGRFTLGLGASGPQVIEGFHGVRYDAPLQRTREIVSICRQVWRREPLEHRGERYTVPLTQDDGGSGLGKPLKLIGHPVRASIPISLAALGPKNVALAAEIADGWQPLFLHPGKFDIAFGEAVAIGMASRDPSLGPLDIQVQVKFRLSGSDPSAQDRVRKQLALYLGGMGARRKNLYNELAHRYGYGPEASEIQDLYLSGRKADAERAVPDDLVQAVSLIGDEQAVLKKLGDFSKAGVTTLLLDPVAADPQTRVEDVRRLIELTRL